MSEDRAAAGEHRVASNAKRSRLERVSAAFCLLGASAGVWLHAGLPAALVGTLLAALALAGVSVPSLFAASQVLVAAAGVAGLPLAIAEAGAFASLAVTGRAGDRLATAGTTAVALGGLLACWSIARTSLDAPWAVALALAVAVAFVAYGLHRYERLRLGELDPDPAGTDSPAADGGGGE